MGLCDLGFRELGAEAGEQAAERVEVPAGVFELTSRVGELVRFYLVAPGTEVGRKLPDRALQSGALGVELERPGVPVGESLLESRATWVVTPLKGDEKPLEAIGERCELIHGGSGGDLNYRTRGSRFQ